MLGLFWVSRAKFTLQSPGFAPTPALRLGHLPLADFCHGKALFFMKFDPHQMFRKVGNASTTPKCGT